MIRCSVIAFTLALSVLGCQKGVDPVGEPGKNTGKPGVPAVATKPKLPQKQPPLPLKAPPADAQTLPSGLVVKMLGAPAPADAPKLGANDTARVRLTGWKQDSGETFVNNDNPEAPPTPMNVAAVAPGMREALLLMKKGETAMVWMKPELAGPVAAGSKESLVYAITLVDIDYAPKPPADVAAAPAEALTLPVSGAKYVVVKAGSGAAPREFDEVSFQYSLWQADGKLVDSSETRKRPVTSSAMRMPPALAEMLLAMPPGQRNKYWLDAEKLGVGAGGPSGLMCVELEVVSVTKPANEPPPVPKDVAAPPKKAMKSPKGVSIVVLSKGKGPKPTATSSVKVHYTGWTTNGRMFDSSRLAGQPAEFNLQGVVAGWTDAFPLLSAGDKARLWIPEELAYKGAPGKPQGMLVFDVELLEVKEGGGGAAGNGDAHDHDEHGH